MSLKLYCDVCSSEINEPGGLIFGPPIAGWSLKYHICKECWWALSHILNKNK